MLTLKSVTFITLLCVSIIFLAAVFWKRRFSNKQVWVNPVVQKVSLSASVEDFSGDNRYDTELDLAQAYLELHQHEKAKHLLKSVIDHGAPHQILEARKMFTLLLKQERGV